MITFLLLAVVVVVLGFIRLSPSDPGVWHQPLAFSQDQDLTGGARRVREGNFADPETFALLNEIILETPRTERLAGGVEEGHVTYVTRSLVFGFPDYTTCQVNDGRLMIFGRLRFGRSDLGVNKARIEGWLARLDAGIKG